MKKWQKSRNYRRLKDENGSVIANIITVDGVNVEVSEEIFLAYSQADRRERYLVESAAAEGILSLEQMKADVAPSAEECCLEREENQTWEDRKQKLPTVLAELEPNEQELIQALFFEGLSAREYARQLGVYHRAVLYRKEQVLEKLRKKFM